MRSKKRNKRAKTSKTSGIATLLRAASLSLLITIPLSLLLLLLAAALLLKVNDPGSTIGVTGIAVLFISSLLCGVLATRLHRRKTPLLCGITSGILLLLFLCIASALLPTDKAPHSLLITLLLHVMILPLTILGAKLGGREKRKHKYHR